MAEDVKIVITALDKTRNGFSTVNKAIKGVAGAVFSLKSAFAAVGGAAGFGYLIKRSLDATDSLQKTADKIGTTTEALSALRYAADISGVATTTLDMAMQRFTRRLSEAAKGTGEAKGALRELNIDAKALQQLPLDKQMIELSGAFAQVESDADKVRLAFKLFDSEGVSLVNTLGLGADGMRELFQEAEVLGLVMSRQAANGVEEAVDSLTKLRSVAKGLIDQFTAALAPAISLAAESLKEWVIQITASEGGIRGFAQNAAKSFLNAVESIVIAAAKGANAIKTMFAGDDSADTSILQRRLKAQQDALTQHQVYLEGLMSGEGSLVDRFLSGDLFKSGNTAVADTQKEIKAIQKLIGSLQQQISEAAGSESQSLIDIGNLQAMFQGLREAVDMTSQSMDELPIEPEKLSQYAQAVGLIKDAFKEWDDAMPTLEESLKSLAKSGMDGFTNAVTSAITGAQSFGDAIKSLAKSVVDSLIKMLVQYYITKPLFDAIGGFIGGSAGAGGSSTIDTGASFAGYAASGGTVTGGKQYMVGEEGPEMFVPSQTGKIFPNDQLGGGGVVVNQTINVSTGVSQTVRAEIINLMPQIAGAAKSAVADGRARGGSFGKALGA